MQPNSREPFGDAVEHSSFAADIDLTTNAACRVARRIDVVDTAGGNWITVKPERSDSVPRALKVTAPWGLDVQLRMILKTVADPPAVQVGGGPAVTLTGTPTIGGRGRITIATGGARGVATFDWVLDGQSGSGVTTAATVALGTTGLTANFPDTPLTPDDDYVAGTKYTFDAVLTNVSRVAVGF